MRILSVILMGTILGLSIGAFTEDYYREIITTQARIIEDLSISLEEDRIYCETVYWHTDKSGKDTVQELCGDVWSEVYNFTK